MGNSYASGSKSSLESSGSERGALNSTTSVEVIATPAAGFTRKGRVLIQNKDTAAVIVRVRVTVAGPTHYEWFSETLALNNPATAPGGHIDLDCPALQAGQSITVALDAAVATVQPAWVTTWIDIPVPA